MTSRFTRFLGKRVAPPRFLLFLLALGAAVIALICHGYPAAQAFILGFDGAALLFLATCLPLLARHQAALIRRHAAANDANRLTLLLITAVVMAAILAALAALLPDAHDLLQKLTIVATLIIAWLFSNMIYAIHYAHLFYGGDAEPGGLGFSGPATPDYGDFIYFAFTLGMTFQTSDTAVETPAFRRIVTLHALAAFLFNLGAVAFTINILGAGLP